MSVEKVDTNAHKIDKRVAAMNKRSAKDIKRGARKIKVDLAGIKLMPGRKSSEALKGTRGTDPRLPVGGGLAVDDELHDHSREAFILLIISFE
jgi:hypothetical protein